MPMNGAGLSDPFNVTSLSLHSSNPGVGASPAGGSELSDSPYARQTPSWDAIATGSDGGGAFARQNLDAAVNFNLATGATAQNVQFVGLWRGSTYLGYEVPSTTKNFDDPDSTSRTFTLTTDFNIINRNA